MSRTRGALLAIALVVFGASIVAQQQNAPAPTGPVPAGLPDWAYTPPVPGAPPPPSALPTDDNAVVKIPGTDEDVHARRAARCEGNHGLVSGGSSRDQAQHRPSRERGRAPVHASVTFRTEPDVLRTPRSAACTPSISCSRCRTSGTGCGRAPIRVRPIRIR